MPRKKEHGLQHERGPHQTPHAGFEWPQFEAFSRGSALAFEKKKTRKGEKKKKSRRQEPACLVTHRAEWQSDLRAWRRWGITQPPPRHHHPSPTPPNHPFLLCWVAGVDTTILGKESNTRVLALCVCGGLQQGVGALQTEGYAGRR